MQSVRRCRRAMPGALARGTACLAVVVWAAFRQVPGWAEPAVPEHAEDAGAAVVEALRERLRVDPHDREARVRLIRHYDRNRSEWGSKAHHAEHVLWMIENAPRDPLFEPRFHRAHISRFVDRERHDRAKALWLRHLESAPDDLKLLGNAASYFRGADRELAISLLEAAQAIDPHNAKWPFELAMHHWPEVRRRSSPARAGDIARAASHFAQAYALAGGGGPDCVTYAVYAMHGAFAAGRHADAREYAEAALREPCHECDAPHEANIVLGHIALAAGDVSLASEHLLAATRVTGSPALRHFGPNMVLARELLERGQRDVVLEYMELCRSFWDSPRLTAWAEVVRDGEIPDFGANLLYGRG